MSPVWQLILLLILTVSSAFFSSAETAITSMGRIRLAVLIKEHKRCSRALQALLDHPNNMITALLIANNFVNILASVLAAILTLQLLPNITKTQAGLLTTLLMTIYLLIFAEITPKNFAKNHAEKLTLAFINVIFYLTRILLPAIISFRWISDKIIKLLPRRYHEREPVQVSEDQIKLFLEVGQERGLIKQEEAKMIRRIFAYDDLAAYQVMIPRTEVKALEINTPLIEAREFIAEEGHSRYPVYQDYLDNVVGVLHAKDLLKFGYEEKKKLEEYKRLLQEELPQLLQSLEGKGNLSEEEQKEYQELKQEQEFYSAEVHRLKELLSNAELKDIIRPPYFVPPNKPINVLLREFQRDKRHMAIVVDEYGGMMGIITLEDIIEEIVGEIRDEYDESKELIKKVASNEFLVDGATEIGEINERLNLNLPTEEGVTISGLLLHRLEEIPKAGASITIDGTRITVEEATAREIISVRVQLPQRTESYRSFDF